MFFRKYPPSIIYIRLPRSSIYSTPKQHSSRPCSVQKPTSSKSMSAALVFLHLYSNDIRTVQCSVVLLSITNQILMFFCRASLCNPKASNILMNILSKKVGRMCDVCSASGFLFAPFKRRCSGRMFGSSALSHHIHIDISAERLSLFNL
jgi:hypothetical protein